MKSHSNVLFYVPTTMNLNIIFHLFLYEYVLHYRTLHISFSPIRKVHSSSALKFNALWHFFFPISLFNTWRLWVYPCQMFIFGIPITTAQEVLTEWLIKTITIIILSKYLVSNVFFLCYDSSVKSLVHKCFKFALCMFETRENNTKTRLYK